jgi:hypothetical protein
MNRLKEIISNIFIPFTFVRLYLQIGFVFALIPIIFYSSYFTIKSELFHHFIKGKIIDVKIGAKGGGVGKYSGRSTYYHIQLQNFKKNFLLEDASIFENWQFDKDDFKVGDEAEFKIKEADIKILNAPTAYVAVGPQRIMWPEESSSVKIYGLTINGEQILSTDSSVRGLAYNTWFWIIIPLFVYMIFLMGALYIRTDAFKYWTSESQNKADELFKNNNKL